MEEVEEGTGGGGRRQEVEEEAGGGVQLSTADISNTDTVTPTLQGGGTGGGLVCGDLLL